ADRRHWVDDASADAGGHRVRPSAADRQGATGVVASSWIKEPEELEVPLMEVSHALAGAAPVPFWLDDPGRPHALPALGEDATCDLAVVGGGYSGLWTAL